MVAMEEMIEEMEEMEEMKEMGMMIEGHNWAKYIG